MRLPLWPQISSRSRCAGPWNSGPAFESVALFLALGVRARWRGPVIFRRAPFVRGATTSQGERRLLDRRPLAAQSTNCRLGKPSHGAGAAPTPDRAEGGSRGRCSAVRARQRSGRQQSAASRTSDGSMQRKRNLPSVENVSRLLIRPTPGDASTDGIYGTLGWSTTCPPWVNREISSPSAREFEHRLRVCGADPASIVRLNRQITGHRSVRAGRPRS